MINIFKCKHPWAYLAPLKREEILEKENDIITIMMHIHCYKCGKDLKCKYCTLSTTAEEFLR